LINNNGIKKITFQLLIFLLFTNTFAQLTHHHIGRLWQTMFPVGSRPNYAPLFTAMNYPGGDFLLGKEQNMRYSAIWIGVKNFNNKLNEYKPFYVSEGGYLNAEAPGILESISNRKWVRQVLPSVEVNDKLEVRTMDNRKSSLPRPSLESDEKIVTIWATDVGIEVTRTSYAFANRRHDSYIIQEHVFKNTGNVDSDTTIELRGQDLEEVYLGFWRVFIPSLDNSHGLMGYENDEWCHYYGNQPGDSLKGFWYVYDGDNQYKIFDDTGDPSELNGEFLAPQYIAFGMLHADSDYLDETHDPSQPITVNFWPFSRVPSHTKGHSEQRLYLDLSSGEQSQGSDIGKYANPWDLDVKDPQLLMAFGPYNIPFGEDVRIVIYEAIGSIDRAEAIKFGKEWQDGSLEWNGLTGDAAKNSLLATGKDSLYQVVHRAEWAWEKGLDAVPDGPESPNLRLSAGPGKIELEWYYGASAMQDTIPPKPDNDTGVYDFAGYRLYRTEEHFTNLYYKIWECGGNSDFPITNKYVDRNVKRGHSYYYYVVAYDDGTQNSSEIDLGRCVESSHFSNRNIQYAAIPFEAARPKLDSVYVVPNPFHFQGLQYGGSFELDYNYNPTFGARPEDRIAFVGLPAKAIIRIFTVHGNLIKTLYHPNPENPESVKESADEMWFQITDSWQTVKSGLYFFHVEGWDLDNNFVGTTTGKFVIIR
jgi:hypothetical protein